MPDGSKQHDYLLKRPTRIPLSCLGSGSSRRQFILWTMDCLVKSAKKMEIKSRTPRRSEIGFPLSECYLNFVIHVVVEKRNGVVWLVDAIQQYFLDVPARTGIDDIDVIEGKVVAVMDFE